MKKSILFLAFILSSLSFYGQKTSLAVSGQLSFPQGDYKSTFPVTGYGLRVNVMHRLNLQQPLSIGGELGFMVTGNSSRLFDIYYYGFYDLFRVTATNNVIAFAFKARADLVPIDKPVQLYVDGTVGTNLFFSSVDIERETYYGQNDFAGGNSTKGYWSFVFGPGVGVEVALNKRRDAHLLLKGSYQFGSTTKYLTDPYIDNNGNVYFTQRESKTDMVIGEVGVRFGLGRR